MELGPYTNFHELNLDWFLNEFNKVLAEWEDMQKSFSDLNAAFSDLRNYVYDYFKNLNVQDEIDKKLDDMANDGSLYAIIRKYTDPIVDEQNSKITVLENRMNTFTSLPEGSTSGDAELIDIRVPAAGFNGNAAYTNAGDAVRGQVSDLKRDLIEDTNKLWVDFPYTKGNYLTKYGGLSAMETSYVTDYVPVKSGQKIQVSGYAGNEAALYAFYSDTQANTMISIYVPEEYKHYTQIVEVPEGANYILASSFTDTDRFFIRIICDYDDLIEAIEKVNNAEQLIDYKPKYGNHLKKPFDFRNKNSVWFGDSITEGVTSPNLEITNENYPTLFASYVGASTVYNRAVSGSCIADSDNQYSILNRILNYSYGAKDFTFIAGGTNDYTTGKQVGTFGDTTADTFYGALHLICEHLKTNDNFVNSTVIFITPINQNKNRDNPNAITSINTYRNAIYEIATSYGFNVVDGSQIGFPIERGGFADELCTDGVHPTLKGHEYYAVGLCGILM